MIRRTLIEIKPPTGKDRYFRIMRNTVIHRKKTGL